MSKSLSSLIKKLMNKDPKERLGHNNGIEGILEHRFFSGTPIVEILRGVSFPPIVPQLLRHSPQVDVTEAAQLAEMQRKLEIEAELECNTYEKTVKEFEYRAVVRSPSELQSQRTFDLSLGIMHQKDDLNYYFDMNDSDLRRKMLKARRRMKSVKK